jgi:hypothetical protein
MNNWQETYEAILRNGWFIPVISFNWTVEQLLAGIKIETRRCWTKRYYRTFISQIAKTAGIFYAVNKALYRGGKRIAVCQVIGTIEKQSLDLITTQTLIAEGNLWKNVEEFKKLFDGRCQEPYVIHFKVIKFLPAKD